MEEDPAVSTESCKRKKRRSGSSISCHKRSRKAKSVKPGVVQNEFPNQSLSFAEPPLNVVAKQPSQAQKLKLGSKFRRNSFRFRVRNLPEIGTPSGEVRCFDKNSRVFGSIEVQLCL
jgi:hypothetical protein